MEVDHWDRDDARETPVDDGCVWCKVGEPDATVPLIAIPETGEQICTHCLEDLRSFGRFEFVQYWAYGGMEPALKGILQRVWEDEVQPELADRYAEHDELYQLPRVISDARKHEYPG